MKNFPSLISLPREALAEWGHFSTRRGVTLVELLIAIAVISILVSGLVMLINPSQKIGQANDAKRKGDIAQLQRALEIYYQDNQKYPASTGNAITGAGWGSTSWTYMSKVPQDPTPSSRNYVYYTPTSGSCSNSNYQCYFIYANLQRTNDLQACVPGTATVCASASSNGVGNSCGTPTATCNYGVSSPNTTP